MGERELGNHNTLSRRTFLGGLVGLAATSSCSMWHMPPERSLPPENYEISRHAEWRQDFTKMPNGPIDARIWHVETNPAVPGYNDEQEAYIDDPGTIGIKDGALYIQAYRQDYRYPNDQDRQTFKFISGRIDTRDTFGFDFGRIEARIQLPAGVGTWPAFWLLSADDKNTKGLPHGEVDIFEAYGATPNMATATLHVPNGSKAQSVSVPHASSEFHTYGVDILPNNISFLLDGKSYLQIPKKSDNPRDWPFMPGNHYFPILNLAIGGTDNQRIDLASEPKWKMLVKEVSYYPML